MHLVHLAIIVRQLNGNLRYRPRLEYPNAYLKDIDGRKTSWTLLINFKVARSYIH